jgi:hypothetical protein
MKSTLTGVSLLVFAFVSLLGGSLRAESVFIDDVYIGGTASNSSYSGDIIGDGFNTKSMTVEYTSGGLLRIDIESDYVNNIGKLGTQLGDVFISTDGWTPYGTAPYMQDNMNTGEDWEFALVLDDHLGSSGSIWLYTVEDTSDIITSDVIHAGTSYAHRKYQEVHLDYSGLTALATGTWTTSGDNMSITIDTGTVFDSFTDLGFHWTMSCGNDVIEGRVNIGAVPEPGLITLLGLGVLGLLAVRKRG